MPTFFRPLSQGLKGHLSESDRSMKFNVTPAPYVSYKRHESQDVKDFGGNLPIIRKPPANLVPLVVRDFHLQINEKVHPREALIDPDEFDEGPEDAIYNLGHVVWAKCPGFPYWPALVVIDPSISNKELRYYKQSKGGKFEYYYLQYFGENLYKGWTRTNCILCAFDGKDGWDDYRMKFCTAVSKLRGDKRRRKIRMGRCSKSDINNYQLSINEAIAASRLMYPWQRAEALVYNYIPYEEKVPVDGQQEEQEQDSEPASPRRSLRQASRKR